MGKRRNFVRADIKLMRELHCAGLEDSEIAAKFNTSRETVNKLRNAAASCDNRHAFTEQTSRG